MFKTKVLNKHLALALTSGLLLMANAVNAEPYIIREFPAVSYSRRQEAR